MYPPGPGKPDLPALNGIGRMRRCPASVNGVKDDFSRRDVRLKKWK
jgi:hypothetical protein